MDDKNDDNIRALVQKHIQDAKKESLELRALEISTDIERALKADGALYVQPMTYERKTFYVTHFNYKNSTYIVITDQILDNLREFRAMVKNITDNQQYL
jgi:hypothetical protein